MKLLCLLLFAAVLVLAGCNQTAPVTSAPTAAAPDAVVPADTARLDSAMAAATAPPADNAAAPAAIPSPKELGILRLSFSFKPDPNPDDPAHPKTSAHLLLQGAKAMDIDLGKFAGQPDVVDAAKAKLAGFPRGMLLGFRSYHAASGTSSDLAVLNVDGNRLRVVQRRVEETATEPGAFETSREIPLPANTQVVAAPPAKQ
ncbi:hypothetical protein BEN47_14685 [Hymenobacter lapidarius]|uniref:Uncharacterized protein n=1 Tax=Hymenobacter lapidarius TaxID=1908237 RepID=A0A1G1T4D4_9BACT|nr:hypothetical protein [Hymenobacter lapidarius]OGX85728.1 hypothetical protein BEN47_14685 [Hymenobacter lapidarius]